MLSFFACLLIYTSCLLKRRGRVTRVLRWRAPLVLPVLVGLFRMHSGDRTEKLRPSSHRHNDQGSRRLATRDVLIFILKPVLSPGSQFQGRETDQGDL